MLKILHSSSHAAFTDEQLLSQYVESGSATALAKLYERYMPMVYGVCIKILKDSGKSEDAVMAIYEELVRKLPQHQVESFRGWLYVLARNYCLMEWRKMQRRPTDLFAPEDMQRFDAVEASDELDQYPDTAGLERCLETLNQQQKQCVVWFYYEEKSYKDIADLLQDEVGKIRSFIQNGRRNLKICLEKNGNIG